MAKVSLKAGTTSYIATVFIQDSSSTTGAGKTGLAYNTANLTAYYVRPGAAAASISLVTQTTTGAYSSGGFVEIDSTNMPGFYRFDVPDAVLAANAKSASVLLKGAANMAPLPLEFELTAIDNQDSVRSGMTALPNAAAAANGGLPTVDGSNKIAGVQGDTPQTGDSYARIGAAGAGLTALGDTRIANLDAAVTSRLAPTVAGRTLDVSSTGEAGVDWANVGSQSTSVTLSGTSVGAVTTAGTVTDKAGYSLSAAGITAIWDKLTSALTTVGSVGKLIVDYLDAAISSRSTFNYASNQVTVATNNDKTGYTLTTTPATSSDVRTQVDAALDATDAELSSMPAGTSVSLRNRLKFIFQYFRLKRDATATLETMYKDNSTTVLGTAVLSDDGTTVTKAKMT